LQAAGVFYDVAFLKKLAEGSSQKEISTVAAMTRCIISDGRAQHPFRIMIFPINICSKFGSLVEGLGHIGRLLSFPYNSCSNGECYDGNRS
jgi:hypothetical protein